MSSLPSGQGRRCPDWLLFFLKFLRHGSAIASIVKQVGTAPGAGARLRRYASGDCPTISRNVRLNVPRLVKPTSRQMSVMLRSLSRRRNIEHSTRRRWARSV